MANFAAVEFNQFEDAANQISQFVEETKRFWDEEDFQNTELWRSYKEEFENYTEDDFNQINNQQIREFRDFLRQRGVWVEKGRTFIATALYNVLQERECTAWSREEILKCACEEHFTFSKIKWMLDEKKERAAQATALKFRKFFPSTRSKFFKSPAFVSALLAASLATFRSISSEIFISLVQLSTFQQTEQSTSFSPEKTGQNQPAFQRQQSVQQTQSSSAASRSAFFTTLTFFQAAAFFLNLIPLQAAILHDESFYMTSGCIFYRKGMG